MRGPMHEVGGETYGLDRLRSERAMTDEPEFLSPLSQVDPFQARVQQRDEMIPAERLSKRRIGEDECLGRRCDWAGQLS